MSLFSTAGQRARVLALSTASVALAACGGYTAVDIGGTLTNLTGTGLILTNGTDTVSPLPNATTFVFPKKAEIRTTYDVKITAQPTRQTCAIFNPSGIAGAAPVTIVNVVCSVNTYTVGGTVANLAGSGLVLTNGSDRVTVAPGGTSSTPFVFPNAVVDGAAYGVAILTQPAGQNCTVANGTAVMGPANVSNVQVTCS